MTKKELEQYRSIVTELDELQSKINKCWTGDTVTGSDCHFPYGQRHFSVGGVADAIDRGSSERYLIQKRKLELQKQTIEDFVEAIPDSVTRRIFRYRYTDGTVKPSWQWIAFKIGQYDEQYPRRKHNKYLENFQK